MRAKRLSSLSVEQLEQTARDLASAVESGDAAALERLREHFGREVRAVELREAVHHRLHALRPDGAADPASLDAGAKFLIAHDYGFSSWADLERHVVELSRADSAVSIFEAAVEAVLSGDVEVLQAMLKSRPSLVLERSARAHRSTLLHYVSANGVEDYRQRTPERIVEVARLLLAAGAEVDAPSDPGRGTALGLVATSYPPARAGVQIPLMECLLDAGASPDGLAGRGARLAQYGRMSAVELLLQKGVLVDTELPHHRQTGLHWAAYNGHAGVVKLLLDWRAMVNAKDEWFDGTPLGWALYGWADPAPEARSGWFYDVVELLVGAGGTVDPAWLADPDRERPLVEKIHADARMRTALGGQLPPASSMVG